MITAPLHPFYHLTNNVSTPRFSPERQTLLESPLRHPSLTRAGVEAARKLIEPHIHDTPVLTNTTLTQMASKPQDAEALEGTQWEGQKPAEPKVRLFFKAENFQRIGAFKVRGAFHAVKRLIEEEGIEEVRRKGVVTHSSGMSLHLLLHTQYLTSSRKPCPSPRPRSAYLFHPRSHRHADH